jgi:hypothetical protein
MSEPIRAGDWVVVVRTCCDGTAKESLGLMGPVQYIKNPIWIRCHYCKKEATVNRARFNDGEWPVAPLDWLKRIPPMSELEGEKRDEEITA